MVTGNNSLHLLTIDVVEDTISTESKQFSHEVENSSQEGDQINFWEMKSTFGWKHAISTELKNYFPRYHIQQFSGTIRLTDVRLYNCT